MGISRASFEAEVAGGATVTFWGPALIFSQQTMIQSKREAQKEKRKTGDKERK